MQGHHICRTLPARVRTSAGVALVLSALTGAEAGAQHAADRWPTTDLAPVAVPVLQSESLRSTVVGASSTGQPHFVMDVRREAWLLGMAARFTLVGEIVPEPRRVLPRAGFDPADIGWSVDRGVVGNHDPGASRASDRTRDASLLLPLVVSVVTARKGHAWRDVGVGGGVYAEALLISKSLSHLGKVVLGRPRPGAFVPRPDGAEPLGREPVGSGTFHSMPSSHASAAWTGASVAVTSHLLLRPRARGIERFGLGFLGGALAGATSALRVSSGAHFPTDVIAGAGIGVASGVLVPLVHLEHRPLPSRRAVLQSVGGMAVGTLLGVLLGG